MPSYKNITQETVLKAIEGSGGIVRTVAKRLGCKSSTAKKLIERWSGTRDAFALESDNVLDEAETAIQEAIRKKNLGICKWYLRTKGQKRGYVDSRHVTIEQGKPLNIVFNEMSVDTMLQADNIEMSDYDKESE